VLRQPALATTLERIARAGAMDFYTGEIATEILADLQANGGWISASDLADFPEPRIVEPLRGRYRDHEVLTLPPPFGGWVVLQILNVLEQMPQATLAADDDSRRLAMLDALQIGHGSRKNEPVENYLDYSADITPRISKAEAIRLLNAYHGNQGGETTHFSVVDGDGLAVAVTQSIDSYFGARVAHPTLGFLYNNYMQGFQVDDPQAPYFLAAGEMPKSSMSATIVRRDGRTVLVLGSPGSARIISAVAQVTSHWVDIRGGVEQAVSAYRVHTVPPDKAYVEGPEVLPKLLAGIAARGMTLVRPKYGVSDSYLDPYFGGVHAMAWEDGSWTGAPDPRRDGRVGYAWLGTRSRAN
jgi:gamma-glutamyltranspeptidase/glutathione hydrolase